MKKVVTFNADKPLEQTVSVLPYLKTTQVVIQGYDVNGDPNNGTESDVEILVSPYFVGDESGGVVSSATLNGQSSRRHLYESHSLDNIRLALNGASFPTDLSKLEVTIYQS
ncbi:hypothetical protein [Vibrio phage vB_VhaS-a]|nr:hypothetical protein [Vibrio phage vB_VhaS-a]